MNVLENGKNLISYFINVPSILFNKRSENTRFFTCLIIVFLSSFAKNDKTFPCD